jgi:signal transduction protein with GAF and PtsI domain
MQTPGTVRTGFKLFKQGKEMPMSVNIETLRTLQQENLRLKSENQDLHTELNQLRQAIRALCELQQNLDYITPHTNVFALISRILSSALDAVDSQDGSLQLLDEEAQELVFVEVQGTARERLLNYRMPHHEGIAGWVIANHKPRLVPDTNQEPIFSPLIDRTIGFRTNSLICVPLLDQERIMGVIEVVNTRSGDPFKEKDMDILLLVAQLAGLAIVKAEGKRI